jgi:phage shock protein PspC (stress-responsive transcriptional regulator)
MNEQGMTEPRTALDKSFDALRRVGIRRRTDDKWIAGVCSGLADRLGVDPVLVRAGVVLLSLLGGVGVTAYLVAWALLPDDSDQIAAERALRDGDGGSIVLIIFATLSLFGGSWWSHDSGWGFPWGLVITGGLIWWLVKRSRDNKTDPEVRPGNQTGGGPGATRPSPPPFISSSSPIAFASGQSPTAFARGPSPTAPIPSQVAKRPRRRSGGPLMALLAVGLALVTYGSLMWLGTEYEWAGDHRTVAMSGSLAVIGLLLVALGLAGWRAGFVAFLALVLAITAWSSSVLPSEIRVGGRVGEATWAPTSVTVASNYRLGVGNGVLDLRRLPIENLNGANLSADVGIGEMTVIVPQELTVLVRAHVGLGEILLPGDPVSDGEGGSDVSRSVVVGDGPTEVVVDAGVGLGQLSVVKE